MSTKAIVLVKPHRHDGVLKQAGTEISVATRLANWLIGQGIARDADAARKPQPAALLHRPCCGRR